MALWTEKHKKESEQEHRDRSVHVNQAVEEKEKHGDAEHHAETDKHLSTAVLSPTPISSVAGGFKRDVDPESGKKIRTL